MVNESADSYGLSSMTKAKIINLCKKHKLYVTPRLNDVLYLHYQGFTEIKELDEYVGLKCLYLIYSYIRCLLLHNNVIKKIENLEHCIHLDSINLSHNFIMTIENLGSDKLPKLNTLTITNNCLRTEESIANLIHCKTLSVLDLSHNRIDDIVIVKVLGQMPELRVLVLTGNPVVNEIPSYRKTLILNCKSLTYLDTRPVFDVDRACAEAWKRGGYEEERNERMRWNQEERRKLISSIHSTLDVGRKGNSDGENTLISSSEHVELKSNDQQESSNDETSNSDDSCSKDYQDIPDHNELTPMDIKASETSEDFNNSDEFHDVETGDSDDSFVSSLEQVVGTGCPFTTDNIDETQNDEFTVFDVDRSQVERNGTVLIEEIEEKTNVMTKENLSIVSATEIDGHLGKEIEIVQVSEIDQLRGGSNATKITFYCESIDKLMADAVGDESEEIIQEMTSWLTVDSSV